MILSGGSLLMALLSPLWLHADGDASYPDLAFELGPVAPTVDLRNMVRDHVVRQSLELLEEANRRREQAIASGQWETWRDGVRAAVARDLGPFEWGDLNVRAVSRHEAQGCSVENVLFESLPGWDVNASVFLPNPAAYPPPWPAIVLPVGHSAKTRESYQVPAQVFARLGYAAITFDPPGMAGEKQPGNDHFNDGVRCYLTGWSSNRYFVADALRCIDYLATRADVDLSGGVGMTGVSGGGFTTMFATLLDRRIRAAGPSCTAVPQAYHPVLDNYAPCPETGAFARFAHYDDTDVLAAAMPTPVLLMAGAEDEVFRGEWSDEIARRTREAFEKAGHGEQFGYFSDPGGHAYTVAMAIEFARWMDQWVRGVPPRDMPAWTSEDFELLPEDAMACRPRTDVNMFSLNRDRAAQLRAKRSGLPVTEAAAKVARVHGPVAAPEARTGKPAQAWYHLIEEAMLLPEPGIELPATLMRPMREGRGGALLFFDDRGRWTDLRRQGPLAQLGGMFEKDTAAPLVLTVDLRGWGDSRPADTVYDLASWADRSRWIAYVSVAAGDPVLAQRIRDGLAALAWLRTRPEVDADRIVVGGHGMGGVVALHVAAIDGGVAGVFSVSAPASFEQLAAESEYTWSHEDFLPEVLLHYDLHELTAALSMPVFIVDPLDARKERLAEDAAVAACKAGEGVEVQAQGNGLQGAAGFVRRLTAP